jgi:hypothetical protein
LRFLPGGGFVRITAGRNWLDVADAAGVLRSVLISRTARSRIARLFESEDLGPSTLAAATHALRQRAAQLRRRYPEG